MTDLLKLIRLLGPFIHNTRANIHTLFRGYSCISLEGLVGCGWARGQRDERSRAKGMGRPPIMGWLRVALV
jgi:hypothetical protein